MEPTIYKPSIYKGAGIYKTGAGGGNGTGVLFYTWFDNVVNKIDTPIVGPEYSLDDENATLSIVNLTSNKFIGNKTFLKVENNTHSITSLNIKTPDINLNGLFSLNFLFNASAISLYGPNFIWVRFNLFDVVIFLSNDIQDYLGLWISDSQSLNSFNGAVFKKNEYGYNQYNVLENIDLSTIRRFKIEFHKTQKLIISIDDVVYLEVLCDLPEKVYTRIDPRNYCNISVSDIMIRNEP